MSGETYPGAVGEKGVRGRKPTNSRQASRKNPNLAECGAGGARIYLPYDKHREEDHFHASILGIGLFFNDRGRLSMRAGAQNHRSHSR